MSAGNFEYEASSKAADVKAAVPEKCQDCPNICDIVKHLASLETASELVVDASMSDEVQEIIADIMQTTGMPEHVARGFAQEKMKDIRRDAGDALDKVDAEFEKKTGEISELTSDCPGTLKLRAKDKLGRSILVAICSSPTLLPNDVPWRHENVHINRSPFSNKKA